MSWFWFLYFSTNTLLAVSGMRKYLRHEEMSWGMAAWIFVTLVFTCLPALAIGALADIFWPQDSAGK